jgi:PAS domain S-box-containing protein
MAQGLCVWSCDLDAGHIVWTPMCKSLFGFAPGDHVTYESLRNSVHPDDRERVDLAVHRAIAERSGYELEFRVIWPDGSLHWVMAKARVSCDKSGRPVRLTGVDMDVTERKQADEALRKAQYHLSEAQQRAHIGIAVRVLATNKLFWSEEVYRLWGYEPGSVTPSRELLLSGIHPDDRILMFEALKKAEREGKGDTFLFRVVRPDGSIRVLLGQGGVIFDKNGKAEKLFGTALDVTERELANAELKKSRRALEESGQLFSTVVEYSPLAILIESEAESGRVVLLNRKFQELLGYEKADLHNAAEFWEKAVPDEAQRHKLLQSLTRYGNATTPVETTLARKDGSTAVIEIHAALVGQLRILTMIDRTVQRETEANLVEAEKLASAARMAASLAHKINNPLAAAINALYLAGTTPNVPDSASKFLKLADNELEQISHLARQTVGFYRETSEAKRVNVPEVLDSILSLYQTKLKNEGITVERAYAESAEVTAVFGELRQVFANLIANAIESMRGGKLHVRVRHRVTDSHPWVRITIADTGSGINRDDIRRVFQPFFTTKKDFGTGLGMWASREIVMRHNGSLRLRSREGRGTVVIVFLPADWANTP